MAEAAQKAALKMGHDDLKYVFEDNQMSILCQTVLISGGITTLRRLSKFASTEEKLREGLHIHFNLDETANLEERVMIGDICSAWLDARCQVAREAETRAEQRTSDVRPPPPKREIKSMREAFISAHGEVKA